MSKTTSIDDIMLGRRSIRQYDKRKRISRDELSKILTEATSAPSSLNMQPWRFVIIESTKTKEKIKSLLTFNQIQCDTSAALICIFGDLQPQSNLAKIMQGSVDHGSMTPEIRDQQIDKITTYYQTASPEHIKNTLLLDGGLIGMNLMLAARKYGYDTCPIGGFEKDQLADALNLDSERYLPLLIISIGKAAEEGYQSYRLPIADITEWQ
ncbi:nitroreductase family protein [uncultured Vagococcus sp.]|uniref:nitroreductase family protein n=1 Tax=uncultured Vagococcus sp. TaxID=189676 RepID=UPI0028D2755C|nr:nitroreductase family protein [uncultured Vagococcus sp.]